MATSVVEGLSVMILLAQDVERTGAFYRDVLGLPLQEEKHDGRHKHLACRLGSIYFTIQLAADLGASNSGQGCDSLQICFTVADINVFMQQLQDRHVTPLHPPEKFERTHYTTLIDPDGRHVRVMTPWER